MGFVAGYRGKFGFSSSFTRLAHSNLSPKYSRSKLGPTLSFLLSTWQSVEKATHTQLKWHTHTPIFHNFSLLTRGVPYSSPQWSDKGIHTLSDICNEKGLRTFNYLSCVYMSFGLTSLPCCFVPAAVGDRAWREGRGNSHSHLVQSDQHGLRWRHGGSCVPLHQ